MTIYATVSVNTFHTYPLQNEPCYITEHTTQSILPQHLLRTCFLLCCVY